jgi:hypothetical protein
MTLRHEYFIKTVCEGVIYFLKQFILRSLADSLTVCWSYSKPGLWIRIRMGSGFEDFLNSDSESGFLKIIFITKRYKIMQVSKILALNFDL